ncbi:aminotransferase class V-fold PLP-dependent enzyme [Kaarinaea lacus]
MDLEKEFPLDTSIKYLNHAAVAPWPTRALLAVEEFAKENNTVGSLHYPAWLQVEARLRTQIQQLINAPDSEDVALLKNTSEALSVVAYGLPWEPGDNVVISDEEFPSNRIVWESLACFGVEVKKASISSSELSPEEALIALCDKKTRVLSISSIQYASGLRIDLEKLGAYCKQDSILFCVDAIQSVGAVAFDVQAAHVDFAMADGHKWMLGPEGLAFFYATPEARDKLKLNQYGWHMVENAMDFDAKQWQVAYSARRFECGSPNMLAIHALSASISLLLETGMDNVELEVTRRVQLLIDELSARDNLNIISHTAIHRLGGIVTFKHRHMTAQDVYQTLSDHGIVCAVRGGGIRFSPHFYTPMDAITAAIERIPK